MAVGSPLKVKYEMKRLENIIQSLDVNIVSNEKYYKLNNLREYLSSMLDKNIEVSDSIFTPYYIAEGKRMELYEYELSIVTETEQSFEEYLLTLTGKQSINDIPDNIKARQKACRVECIQGTETVKVSCLIEYIDYLLNNNDMQCQIKKCFDFFCIDNLFFEVWMP